MAISTVSEPSGSGRVDMLTGPVAAVRGAVVAAAGAWVKSKHDIVSDTKYVEAWKLKLYLFTHPPEDLKKKKTKTKTKNVVDSRKYGTGAA